MYNILELRGLPSKLNSRNQITMLRIAFSCALLCAAQALLAQSYFGPIQASCMHSSSTLATDIPSAIATNTGDITTTVETAKFIIDFEGFSQDGVDSFLRACKLWENVLDIVVPIHIQAEWTLSDSALAAVTPPIRTCNFPNAPLADILYVPALANQFAGEDLSPNLRDIRIKFNPATTYYYGEADAAGGDETDFQSVVVHEIGHGLGIRGTAEILATLVPSIGGGLLSTCPLRPSVYDTHVQLSNEEDGPSVIDLGIGDLGDALVSDNLFWNGADGVSTNGGELPKIYAPNQWAGSSSFGHPDYFYGDDFPTREAVMAPAINSGIRRSFKNIDLSMLADLGWNVTQPKRWYIPNPWFPSVNNAPAIFAYYPPRHYLLARQECMLPSVFADDPDAVPEQSWNDNCIEAYDCCINQGCADESACNYSPFVCQNNPAACRYCDSGAECVTIHMNGSNGGWEIDPQYTPDDGEDYNGFNATRVPFDFSPCANWYIEPLGPVDLPVVWTGTLKKPQGLRSYSSIDLSQGRDGVCLSEGCYSYEVRFDPEIEEEEINALEGDEFGWTLSGINEYDGSSTGYAWTNALPFSIGDVSLIEGCTNPDACNYNPDACIEDGSCDLTEGCTNVFACNFEPAACVNDGSCEFCYFSNCVTLSTNILGFGSGNWSIVDDSGTFPVGITGGSFSSAPEETTFCVEDGCYTFDLNTSGGLFPDPLATWTLEGADGGTISGNGSNTTLQISFGGSGGCTDPEACNYDASACLDLDNCQYPGCTDPGACNYDPDAGDCGFVECEYSEVYVSITDNGSTGVLVYPEELGGCTNELAPNYDADALFDDGSCILSYLCGPGTYYDAALATCLPNSCMGDFDGSGDIGTNDLLTFLGVYGQSCD